jgi:hypothetical protein
VVSEKDASGLGAIAGYLGEFDDTQGVVVDALHYVSKKRTETDRGGD